MNIFKRIFNKCKNALLEFKAKRPEMLATVTSIGVGGAMAFNDLFMKVAAVDANSQIQSGIIKMVSIVSTVVMGVGIILTLVAIFNWIGAVNEEDSARQSKAIVRVVIGGILIIIKPVTYMIVKAVSADTADTYISDWNN